MRKKNCFPHISIRYSLIVLSTTCISSHRGRRYASIVSFDRFYSDLVKYPFFIKICVPDQCLKTFLAILRLTCSIIAPRRVFLNRLSISHAFLKLSQIFLCIGYSYSKIFIFRCRGFPTRPLRATPLGVSLAGSRNLPQSALTSAHQISYRNIYFSSFPHKLQQGVPNTALFGLLL